jgi:phosphatidylinositol alpha 1,6-mannosyltransferase
VAPGEHETFCQVVQEAMASGVAVVAPAVGGPVDLIEHGTDGMLYRPGDANAMAAAVLTLGRDEALRRRLVSAGQRKVRTRSWRALGDQLFDHYLTASGQGTVLEAA